MESNYNLKGYTAIVTGGTRGIGQAIVQKLNYAGAKVIVIHSGKYLNEVEKILNVTYEAIDFSESRNLTKLEEFVKTFKKVDILINNAGINILNEIEYIKENDFDTMINVNLKYPLFLIKNVIPVMRENKFGRIVNIGSIFSKVSRTRRSVYSITKAGIHGLTITASLELARYNILTNTLSPGFTLTEMTKKNLNESEMENLKELIPAGKIASVEDIAQSVLYLSSPLNSYINGQNIICDGGFINE